ncbi:MAG: metalloregulator ArsR/SmtB family transcription factor [Dehalococcoidia bacterium]|mgnify:CR=1 FL=1|nr:metalloregulator ArsR/SmtB family transcription factor [Dehalococcoidia bacterium]HRC63136.1 metalloregulator ArsR/SmtB family transcription factor [Dehalococcoidia bacterium]
MPARSAARPADPRDALFRALADPTRREVVERLGRGAASVSQLAGGFDMALPSFVEHLRVLESSGLVRSQKHGRVRTYELAPEGLRPLEDWLAAQRRRWERRLDQLDDYLLQLKAAEERRAQPSAAPRTQKGTPS